MRDTSSGGWRATTGSPGVATPMGPGVYTTDYIQRGIVEGGLIEISD